MRVTQRKKSVTGQSGFSLMEVLVALAIIALVVGLAGPRVIGYLGGARAKTAEIQIENLKSALNLHLLDTGRYPTAEEGLEALIQNISDAPAWAGPYLDEDAAPLDPWGRPYFYELEAETGRIRLYSFGADGAEGGAGENADVGR